MIRWGSLIFTLGITLITLSLITINFPVNNTFNLNTTMHVITVSPLERNVSIIVSLNNKNVTAYVGTNGTTSSISVSQPNLDTVIFNILKPGVYSFWVINETAQKVIVKSVNMTIGDKTVTKNVTVTVTTTTDIPLNATLHIGGMYLVTNRHFWFKIGIYVVIAGLVIEGITELFKRMKRSR
ncbi:MAG: hypothetical protein JZD40_05720 [Sulfolobus sp.]|nr:hypothetical protein [Sulfolobus sp.]